MILMKGGLNMSLKGECYWHGAAISIPTWSFVHRIATDVSLMHFMVTSGSCLVKLVVKKYIEVRHSMPIHGVYHLYGCFILSPHYQFIYNQKMAGSGSHVLRVGRSIVELSVIFSGDAVDNTPAVSALKEDQTQQWWAACEL